MAWIREEESDAGVAEPGSSARMSPYEDLLLLLNSPPPLLLLLSLGWRWASSVERKRPCSSRCRKRLASLLTTGR